MGKPFELPIPQLHEKEVRVFYNNLAIFIDSLYVTFLVNEVDMGLNEDTLSKILGVPTVGVKTIRLGERSA